MTALESVAGFSEAVQVADQAEEMLAELEQAPPLQTIDLDSIISDGKIPDSLLASVGESHLKTEIVSQKIRILRELRAKAAYRIESIASNGRDEILSNLDSQMQAVVSGIKSAVEALGDASNMTEAVEAGTADAWRNLTQLRGEYNLLRGSQSKVLVEVLGSIRVTKSTRTSDERASELHIRNLDDVWPEWATPVDPATYTTTPGVDADHFMNRGFDSQPWPADTDEFLVWAARNGVAMWIPTTAQVRELADTRFDRLFDREAARRNGMQQIATLG
ncbi:hypothetical protein ACIRRA_44275 [Nocardia sp. NPDC101769]|uniref:hypothetical protein n=1 Tax=Nocardia sp. NPDC101769 TaxID=3364333 RepID=UPI0037F90756